MPGMSFRELRALIEYRAGDGPHCRRRGFEWMSVTRYPDGQAMYRCQSENEEKGIVRDCLIRLDARWRPLESFFDLRVRGEHRGSAQYRFLPDAVEFRGWNPEDGAFDRSVATDGPALGFCPHPVSSDALLLAAFDHGLGRSMQRLRHIYTSSRDMFGATGPTLNGVELDAEYLGQERVDGPAGRLAADRYRIYLSKATAGLVEDIWCLAGTPVFLRSTITGADYPTSFEPLRLELTSAAA